MVSMENISSICVYCGSYDEVPSEYKDFAREVGDRIASEGKQLVYGGARMGLMGVVANSALKKKGKVIGITTQYIYNIEKGHQELTELHIVENLHMRKMMMAERSDAFFVLPGGYGTLDEFFEILTWRQLGLHDKPIIVLNYNNYWDPLKELLGSIVSQKFAYSDHDKLCHFVTSVDEAIEYLCHAPQMNIRLKLSQI